MMTPCLQNRVNSVFLHHAELVHNQDVRTVASGVIRGCDHLDITRIFEHDRFQTMLLVMMNRSRVFLWIAARGMGKSFLIAIFAVARCILYPGTKVVITSGTRGQSINGRYQRL